MAGILETRYTTDYIADFARRKATLVPTVRNDSIDHGGQLVFLIAGDGGQETVMRGANGLIPPSDDVQVQVTVTLAEDISLTEKTSFNIFTSQASQRQSDLMRMNNMAKVHRSQDRRIINALLTGTVSLGAIASMDFNTAARIITILANADVGTEDDGDLFAAISPAAWARLLEITAFASADYVHFGNESPVEAGMPKNGRFKHWAGINWCQHGGLGGRGSSTANCVAWHKNAVGYTEGTRGIDAVLDYDKKQDSTFARTTIWHGAVKLQNPGIVKWTHDDTGLSS